MYFQIPPYVTNQREHTHMNTKNHAIKHERHWNVICKELSHINVLGSSLENDRIQLT